MGEQGQSLLKLKRLMIQAQMTLLLKFMLRMCRPEMKEKMMMAPMERKMEMVRTGRVHMVETAQKMMMTVHKSWRQRKTVARLTTPSCFLQGRKAEKEQLIEGRIII